MKHLLILMLAMSSCTLSAQKVKIKKPVVPKVTVPGTTSPASLSETEIINGLKEALTQGSTKAASTLNQVDGYFSNPLVKIPFPPELQHVENTLRQVGYGKKVDEFILAMNRSAEQAAKESAPIFSNAITNMSFADAKSILSGPDTAATAYLRNTTYNQLYTTFYPHIQTALNNNMVAAKWTELATLYNKLPTTRTKIDTDIVSYTTHKALKGLFVKVAEEEKNIRNNASARTSDLLKKVFGQAK